MKRSPFEIIVVVIGVALLVLIGFGERAQQAQQKPSTYSSYDTGPNGYHALYEVLSQELVPVERLEREIGFAQSPDVTGEPSVGTLVISSTAPELADQPLFSQSLDSSDLQELHTFVKNGMHLVFLDAAGLKNFTSASPKMFAAKGQAATLQRVVPARAKMTTYRIGKGIVTVITAPDIFSNKNLAQSGNASFAYGLLGGNGAVGFYERIHGYVIDKSFWEALPQPVHVAIWIVVAIVVLGLIGANIRFAPPVPIDPPDERDSSAYLSGMASLLRRSCAVKGALGQDDAIELSWLLAGTAPGNAALVRAAILNARSRKETR